MATTQAKLVDRKTLSTWKKRAAMLFASEMIAAASGPGGPFRHG
jgi:hypothetical protein